MHGHRRITHKILNEIAHANRGEVLCGGNEIMRLHDMVKLAHIGVSFIQAKEDIITDMVEINGVYHALDEKAAIQKRVVREVY